MQLSIGNLAQLIVLLGIFVRIHVVANRIEQRMNWVDEMWLDYCRQHGYPVPLWLKDKFQPSNGKLHRSASPDS